MTASFTRLTQSLDPISVTVLDERLATVMAAHTPFFQVAAATLPAGGWVVAISGPTEVSLRALSPEGAEVARAVVDKPRDDASPFQLLLVPQPAAGPLLVYVTDRGMRAAVIAADGRAATPALDLPTADLNGYSGPTATFAGGVFHVAYSIQTSSGEPALRFVRLGTDGRIETVVDTETGELAWAPGLVAGENELRVAYLGLGPSGEEAMLWQRFTLQANALGPAVELDPTWLVFGPAFAAGDETIALVFDGEAGALSAVRIARDGRIVARSAAIARSPALLFDAAWRGQDLVVAWSDPRGLKLARVKP